MYIVVAPGKRAHVLNGRYVAVLQEMATAKKQLGTAERRVGELETRSAR